MRFKTQWKCLLFLCFVTFLGIFIAHKDQILHSLPVIYTSLDGQLTGWTNKGFWHSNTTQVTLNSTSPDQNKTDGKPTKSPRLTTVPNNTTPTFTTTASYLGDTYGWDDTYLISKCPNHIREKLRSEEFKGVFVETIPVLQWKKHATKSEYRRLQRYQGAQGWMGVTWPIVNETLNLLNASDGGFLFDTWKGRGPCVRCAVVGNGGILNGSRMGAEIDGHDYVFRVNGAITKTFEKDVGNRTSFFFFSTNTLMNSLNAYRHQGFQQVPRTEETRYLLLPDHDRDYLFVRAALTNSVIDRGRDQDKWPSSYFGANLTTAHFKILHPDFMRYLRNRFLWSPILNTLSRDIYRPTTGGAMLLTAIHTCDQVQG